MGGSAAVRGDLGGLPVVDQPAGRGPGWPVAGLGRFVRVGLMGIGLAALTEFVQLLPAIGREASVADGATDLLGCAIGLALAPWLEPLLRSIETRLFSEWNV